MSEIRLGKEVLSEQIKEYFTLPPIPRREETEEISSLSSRFGQELKGHSAWEGVDFANLWPSIVDLKGAFGRKDAFGRDIVLAENFNPDNGDLIISVRHETNSPGSSLALNAKNGKVTAQFRQLISFLDSRQEPFITNLSDMAATCKEHFGIEPKLELNQPRVKTAKGESRHWDGYYTAEAVIKDREAAKGLASSFLLLKSIRKDVIDKGLGARNEIAYFPRAPQEPYKLDDEYLGEAMHDIFMGRAGIEAFYQENKHETTMDPPWYGAKVGVKEAGAYAQPYFVFYPQSKSAILPGLPEHRIWWGEQADLPGDIPELRVADAKAAHPFDKAKPPILVPLTKPLNLEVDFYFVLLYGPPSDLRHASFWDTALHTDVRRFFNKHKEAENKIEEDPNYYFELLSLRKDELTSMSLKERQRAINRRCAELLRQFHPDVNPDEKKAAHRTTQEINIGKMVLLSWAEGGKKEDSGKPGHKKTLN